MYALRSQYLWPPVLGYRCGSSCQLSKPWELEIGILGCRRQLGCECGWHFTRCCQFLISRGVRITFQVEQLPLIGKDILHPQARREGMRSSLIHNRDIGACDRGIEWNDNRQIWLACKLIAEAQAEVVPHDSNRYFAFSNVRNTWACYRNVPF